MNILVTGGSGYIGSHSVVELLAAGHNVVIIDSLKNSHASTLNSIAKINKGNAASSLSAHYFDVRDTQKLLSVIQQYGSFDAVIHFAAYKSISESIASPLEYYENNIGGLLSVLECMGKSDIRNLIFSSSAAVYQTDYMGLPLEETSPVGPINPYGRTKLMAEQIISDVVATGQINAAILRYFNPCGAHHSGLIGESPLLPPTNLVPVVCRAAKEGHDIQIFGNDYNTLCGTAVRDYIHVVDLAIAHLKSLDRIMGVDKEALEIFNIGTGQGYSVLEVLNAFNRANSTSVGYKFMPRRDGDMPIVYAANIKAREKLQWKASHGLYSMVKSAWEWHKNTKQDENN